MRKKKLALDFVHELGMTYSGAARKLGVSAGAIQQIVGINR